MTSGECTTDDAKERESRASWKRSANLTPKVQEAHAGQADARAYFTSKLIKNRRGLTDEACDTVRWIGPSSSSS